MRQRFGGRCRALGDYGLDQRESCESRRWLHSEDASMGASSKEGAEDRLL